MYRSDVFIYPIKSGMSLSVASAAVMKDGREGDRRAVIVPPDDV